MTKKFNVLLSTIFICVPRVYSAFFTSFCVEITCFLEPILFQIKLSRECEKLQTIKKTIAHVRLIRENLLTPFSASGSVEGSIN